LLAPCAQPLTQPQGFLLDRGFQIFLTSYPEAQRSLDYPSLALQPFYAGALVRLADASWHRVADPVRHPLDALLTLLPANGVGDVLDKLRVGLLRLLSLATPPYGFLTAPEVPAAARLAQLGFSAAMVDRFWRPFLGGIFFDRQLRTTDRLLTFVMRCLATGSNCLPAAGIGAVAQQLAGALPEGTLRLGARVQALQPAASGATLQLASGAAVTARHAVVLAVEGPEAYRLAPAELGAAPSAAGEGVGTACVYFAAPLPVAPALREPILFLNGDAESLDGRGRLVNNACVPSAVAPSYAPPGTALISASVVGLPRPGSALDPSTPAGDAALAAAVLEELGGWFGRDATAGWRHLRTYAIPYAQPPQGVPSVLERPARLAPWLVACGDHREAATLDGALRSGRRAAEEVLAQLGRK